VISFQDEEGTFLPFLGSRTFCGDRLDAEIATARARDGRALADALATVAQEAPPLRLDPARHRCYLEAHIEQGPRLEAAGRRIGVVTGHRRHPPLPRARAGPRRSRRHHAMAVRRDAGAALIALGGLGGGGIPAPCRARHGLETSVRSRSGPAPPMWCRRRAELTLEFRDLDGRAA